MCLILFAYQAHPRYRLVLAANRDEFYDRPAAPASYWPEAPGLLAGRDLSAAGTWLGVTMQGRFAALTNVREPSYILHDPPSRGQLVADFLKSDVPAERYLEMLRGEGRRYNGFNILFGALNGTLYCYCNRSGNSDTITPGIHGLSNHELDTPWPKVVRGKDALKAALEKETVDPEDLVAILSDATPAPEDQLPHTGVGVELEKKLSSIFIRSTSYGTRCSTTIVADRQGRVTFAERSYNGHPQPTVAREEFIIG